MIIDGYTRLAAVVATPIRHSISPFIHNQAFQQTGVNGVYVAWDIPESDLAVTIDNIKRYNMFGINVSMPYKQAVLPYMDKLTDSARLIGAVNTVIHRDGKLIGHNTDGVGFFRSLASLTAFHVEQKTLTILGAGGAGLAIIAQAALNGAKQINIFKRSSSLDQTQKKAAELMALTGVQIAVLPIEETELLQEKILQSNLLINATNVGMDGSTIIIPQDCILPASIIVADIIYQPFETPLLAFARSKGIRTINGLGMLLFQAAEAFEAWTGETMPTDTIWKALEETFHG
ncbi:shikimate dehydrogenase [Streptococcus sp. ZJ93]|uniref:shikimate dehydrogenase n=1 Tax=Streptococcus handemini TaxID=3161188 RepID=UPI0032EF28EE